MCRSMFIFVSCVGLMGLLGACQSNRQPAVTRSDQETIQSIALRVQNARDSLAEADALKRLHTYAAENRYTYRVNSVSAESGRSVTGAAGLKIPLRAHVTVYRANQPVHDFWFTPKDNRNLALISAEG